MKCKSSFFFRKKGLFVSEILQRIPWGNTKETIISKNVIELRDEKMGEKKSKQSNFQFVK